jgi:DNA-binding transcriptional ArsR family regulator
MSSADRGLSDGNAAGIFAALADETRLSLLANLSAGGERSIAALSADRKLTRQAVTKHLRVLEGAGLVRSTRSGRESRYVFRPEPLREARAYLDRVSAQWGEALARLRLLVEAPEGEG